MLVIIGILVVVEAVALVVLHTVLVPSVIGLVIIIGYLMTWENVRL